MKHDGEGAGHRHARLQRIVFEELSSIVDCEVGDPELEGVVIVAVVMSVDYRHARVHFTVRRATALDRPARAAALRAIERAAPFLRRRLSQSAELKRVPELRFVLEAAAAIGGAP